MRLIILRLILFVLYLAGLSDVQAQQKADSTTTLILLRHAEKDTVEKDPDLSKAGLERSQKLLITFKDLAPDEFYATSFKRTKQTLMPWAERSGKPIKAYDPQNLEAFAQQLKSVKGKVIVIAGHSNTTPMLANLLLSAARYQQLDDSVYNKIFVITIRNDVVIDKIIEY